jgi:aspartate kinase
MDQSTKVFKFGGASVKDAEAIRNVAEILQNYRQDTLLIVLSAMGKTTNALEAVVNAHVAQTNEATSLLEALKIQHYQVMNELFQPDDEVYALVNDTFVEIEWVLDEEPHDNFDYMYDQIVSVGELISTKILCAYLNNQGLPTEWLDARDVILTNELYREAWVQWQETEERFQKNAQPMLQKGGFVITQGFIGATQENFTTTLGRDGSDYSAAIFSFCAGVESMTIWKDAPGVFSADPRFFQGATMLPEMSYDEAIAMTYYGAKIIHLKTVGPLKRKHIPLHVRSFLEPSAEGTTISEKEVSAYPPLLAIETNQVLLQISNKDYSFVTEQHFSQIFDTISVLRMQVTFIQNTPLTLYISVFDQGGKVLKFTERIQDTLETSSIKDLELINIRHATAELLTQLRKERTVLVEQTNGATAHLIVEKA